MTASVAVELTPQRSDSSLASKSTRSHAPMDVEPLNISYGEKQSESAAVKCNHFSIRGYVSEVRKRDPKVCYPFSLNDSAEQIELPPMVVPRFRWWQCDGCVPEASVSCGANDDKEAQKPEEIADTRLLLVGQSSKANVPRVRNGEASTSIDSSDNRNYSPPTVFADPKGKGKAHVEDNPSPSAAWENGFLKDSSQELLQLTTGNLEVSLATANEVGVPGSNCNGNGIINTLQKDSRVEDIEAGATEEVVTHSRELANEKSRGKPQVSSEGQGEDLQTNNMGTEAMELVYGPSSDSKIRLVNLPDLNECSGEPLYDENNEAIVGGSNVDVFCEDDDDYLGAERRKNPKVRLLSELLGVKETRILAKGRKKNTSLTTSLDESVKRKRTSSQDEGSRSMEIRTVNNGNKKISGTTENSQTDSDYETDSDDVEIISKALAKRRCKSKIPLLEKRNKKGKKDQGGSSSISRQKIVSRSVGNEKGKTPEYLPRKSDVTDQLIERSSVLTKKRVPCKNRMSKNFAATQIDEDADKSPAEKVQKASENLHHFSRSFNLKRNCQVRAPPGADGSCLPPTQAEPMQIDGCSVSKHHENRNNLGETSVACRSTVVKNPLNGNGERSTAVTTVLKEKRSRIPEAEEGTPLVQDMHQQVSKPVNQKELANEVQRRMRDIDINSIPADDKVTEQGPVDDIPMDIVELMAKNQYERHLSDPQEKHNHPASSGISITYVRDNAATNSYGEGWQKFGQQPQFLSMQKPPSTDARNSMVNGNLSYVSDLNRNYPSVPGYLPRENLVSSRFLAPTQAQEHRSPYPPSCGLSLNNWNGAINVGAPQRYPPPSFLQPVDSYRYRACAPRQNSAEAHHQAWPSVVTSRMPLGITNPQMISQSSTVLNKAKIHHQSSGSMLNFNASPAAAHLGKQQNLDFSNAYSVGHSENSAGSAEYNSDAVSAVELLNLMQTVKRNTTAKRQNAAQMQNTGLSLGPQKVVVGPSSSRQPFVENNSRSSAMLDNSSRHPCYPTAIPTARPHFASAVQVDRGSIGRSSNAGFVGPIPLTLRGQRNIESSHFAHPGVDHQPGRQQLRSFAEKGKNISTIPQASYVNSMQGVKDAAPNFLSGVRRDEKAISTAPEELKCQLNQNPSEFSDPREWSRYMIGPEDLKPKGTAREKTARPKGNSRRHGLNKAIPSGREREKQRRS